MNPPILLFGATSILGFNLAKRFPLEIRPFVPTGNKSPSIRHWPLLHLEDADWIRRQFNTFKSKILIYCHAVCDVRKCEDDPEWAYAMNVAHLKRTVEVMPEKTRLIYISSDHVFGEDGRYTENALPSPISIYGRTRLAAEQLVLKYAQSLVLRIGLPIGASPNGRNGHLDWLRYRSERGLPITIIEDESRSAVCVEDLSTRVMQFSKSELTGIRHIPATQLVSRVALAKYLLLSMEKKPTFKIENRKQQPTPHLGRVALDSLYDDALANPLPGVLEVSRGSALSMAGEKIHIDHPTDFTHSGEPS